MVLEVIYVFVFGVLFFDVVCFVVGYVESG